MRNLLKVLLPVLLVSMLGGAVPARASTYSFRGVYGPGSYTDQANAGFSVLDASPYVDELNAVAALGAKAWIWLRGYSNTTCTFNQDDAWVSSHVSAIAGNPVIAAYFIDDEPNSALCPTAPAQMHARSELVKSIDPLATTFIVVYKTEQFASFAGTVDVLGLDHYPCSYTNGCLYKYIDQEAAVADSLGVRYWIVIQAFGEDYYKLPTVRQLHREFNHARATNMEGYIVYAWESPPGQPSLWLSNHPKLIAQLKLENAA